MLQRREVLAPEDGKVTNIRAYTPGSSIAGGEPILDLVPIHDRFVVEAQVMPVDIEQVEIGQRVNVRLTSYRMRSMPLIPGRLIYVAADAQQTQNGTNFYSVRAELDSEVLKTMPDLTLRAGMPCEIYILGEKRTPFDYLWAPIRSSVRRAFRD